MILLGDDNPEHSRWTPRNRALAGALTIYEASICSGCGHSLHETTDEDGPDFSAEDFKCNACAVLQANRESTAGNEEPGTYWSAVKTSR